MSKTCSRIKKPDRKPKLRFSFRRFMWCLCDHQIHRDYPFFKLRHALIVLKHRRIACRAGEQSE